MRIVLAPDSFKESMSSPAAARAMRRGIEQALPSAVCVEVPMADGGEGTTRALVTATGGRLLKVATTDALGREHSGEVGLLPDGRAALEAAGAVGMSLVAPAQRDIMASSSLGVAALVRGALDAGARRLIVGLGGSATNDGGAGLLVGLGARLLDDDGRDLPPLPRHLGRVTAVDMGGLDPRLSQCTIELACDVTAPLLGPQGASAVFGPQKGADPQQVRELDTALTALADAVETACNRTVRHTPGAGAAGGLGHAFMALGAVPRSGVEVVMGATGLRAHLAGNTDLVLTGEGAIDAQTLTGKTPAGVAGAAREAGVPVIAFAGRVDPGSPALEAVFDAVVPILPEACDLPRALERGPENLERSVSMVMRLLLLGQNLPQPARP